MSIQDFLIKLKKQGKIEIVEKSEEISNSYLEKSESNLSSAKILFNNKKLEEAIYLSYYSMYNSAVALLSKVGIKCENHSASIFLLNRIFNIDNSPIKNAKKERIDKQYYTDFKIIEKDVLELIKTAESFNNNLFDFISRLTNEKINLYREKIRNI